MSLSHSSVTAKLTAATLLVARHDPRLSALVDAPTESVIASCLRRQGPHFRALVALRHSRAACALALWVQRRDSPGFCVHYAARKRCMFGLARAAIEDGFRQVVLLGAGFDMASHALAQIAGLTIIEVDHPATQRDKLRGMNGAAPLPPNVTFRAADFERDSLAQALSTCPGFDAASDTLYVAEGLLMYLTPGAVDRLFEQMRMPTVSAGRPRVRCILSTVSPDAGGRLCLHSQGRLARAIQLVLRERFIWGPKPEAIEPYLRFRGWTIGAHLRFADFLRAGAPKELRARAPRDTGESVVVAEAV